MRNLTSAIATLGDFAVITNRKLDVPQEMKENLLSSAQFFESHLDDPYLVLLGSASYYLGDKIENCRTLIQRINGNTIDLDGEGLEDLLLWLLRGNYLGYSGRIKKPFEAYIKKIVHHFYDYNQEELLIWVDRLREAVYDYGTPRQLLLGDVIVAIIRKIHNALKGKLTMEPKADTITRVDAIALSRKILEQAEAERSDGEECSYCRKIFPNNMIKVFNGYKYCYECWNECIDRFWVRIGRLCESPLTIISDGSDILKNRVRNPEATCATCPYFSLGSDKYHGTCCKNAITASAEDGGTNSNCWCGDHPDFWKWEEA